MSPKPLRVAVIGTGAVARLRHLPAYKTAQAAGLAELVAVCDPVEGSVKSAAAQFVVPYTYRDYHDVLQRDDIDLVSVSTPNSSHEEISLAALESGKHVMCEKPLATSLDGARRMTALAGETGLRNSVNYRYRWIPSARYLTELIQAGALGEVYHVQMQYFNGATHDPTTPIRWRQMRAERGGALDDIGSHLLDLAHLWVGPIRRIQALQKTFIPERPAADGSGPARVDVDEATFSLLEFANGAAGVLSASTVAVGHRNHIRVEIYGTKGGAIFEIGHFDAGADHLQLCFGSTQGHYAGFSAAPVPPWHLQSNPEWPIIDFVRAVVENREHHPTFSDAVRVQEVLEAAERSAREGNWVPIE